MTLFWVFLMVILLISILLIFETGLYEDNFVFRDNDRSDDLFKATG